MTDEEIKQKFKETYPDLMGGNIPLSPYYDIWCYAIEIMEEQIEKMKSDVIKYFGDEYNVLVTKLLEEWKLKE